MRGRGTALGALAAVLLCGCTASGQGELTVRPAMSSTDASAVVLARMQPHVESIAPDVVPSPGNENLPNIRVVATYDADVPGDEARASWYAEVAGAAVIELMRGGHAADEVAEGVDVRLRRGAAQPEAAGTAVELDGFGLEDVRVEKVQPLGTGLAVTATLPDDVEVDWTLSDLYDRLLDGSVDEGVLVEIDDARGAPLVVMGRSVRGGGGGGWWAPGQDEVFGILHGGSAFS